MNESSAASAPRSDAELISAAASGDDAAFAMARQRHEEAVRRLAGLISADPGEIAEIVAATFARLRTSLRDGGGPRAALRPYLLTAVRWTAFTLLDGGTADGAGDIGGPAGQALFADPAAAELVRSTLSRAFMSLPERWRATLWHTSIEQTEPAEAATLLGIPQDGVTELAAQARAGMCQAYLSRYLSTATGEECVPAMAVLQAGPDGTLSGMGEPEVRQHLRDCPDCRAAAEELAHLDRSLRRVVAPIFLGAAAAAYLSAARGVTVAGLHLMPPGSTLARRAAPAARESGREPARGAGDSAGTAVSTGPGASAHPGPGPGPGGPGREMVSRKTGVRRAPSAPRPEGEPRRRYILAASGAVIAVFAVVALVLDLNAKPSPSNANPLTAATVPVIATTPATTPTPSPTPSPTPTPSPSATLSHIAPRRSAQPPPPPTLPSPQPTLTQPPPSPSPTPSPTPTCFIFCF